jgi:hypothetical protein
MTTTFDLKTGTWNIAWPGRVSRHDVVFLTPPTDPIQGIPLGNGEIGVLTWCESSKLILAFNKSDLWDDADPNRFGGMDVNEIEFSTTLRHAGRMILDFHFPIFDLFYLADFQARLSLADASMELSVAGPFGKVTVHGFVDHDSGVYVCKVDSRLKENIPVDVILERYGSRTFSNWYSIVNRNPEIGFKGTKAITDGQGGYLIHKLTSGIFAMGAGIKADGLEVHSSVENSHTVKITVEGTKNKTFEIYAAVTSPVSKEPVKAVKAILVDGKKTGRSKLFIVHKQAWKTFWLRSLMEFGDDYLDSLWHVTMYYAAASQGGKYPGRFINGLWTWNRDVQNWNFYYHWNQQQIYWPLNAAGHHDLIGSYLDYRFNSLPHAQADAKAAFNTDGAYVSDICGRRGYNAIFERQNHTPVAQIAMEFWRQYQFTGDREFLKTKALPYIREAAYFFESLFEKEKDGKYHAKEGSGYEGLLLLHDCVSELVCGKVLFATALEALKEAGEEDPRADRWREILEHLEPLPMVKADKEFIQKGKYLRGWFKGESAVSDKLLSAGLGVKEKKWLTSMIPEAPAGPASEDVFEAISVEEGKPSLPDKYRDDIRCYDGIFPWVEYSAVFPSGLVGLTEKGTQLYNTAVNTVKMFACPGMGWSPLAIALARLGLGSETRKIINSWPVFWQFYCNGWGHWGPLKGESFLPGRRARMGVLDVSLPDDEIEKHRFPFQMYPFRHMGMESMSVFAAAVNDSLLQSHDGIIRVAPAVTDDHNAKFTLHAQGGFVVSSEIKNGKPMWIAIESRLGKTCTLANPWPKAVIYENGKKADKMTGATLVFSTAVNSRYLIVPNESVMKTWKTVAIEYNRNNNVKTHSSGYASLGLPRMF